MLLYRYILIPYYAHEYTTLTYTIPYKYYININILTYYNAYTYYNILILHTTYYKY